MTVRQQIDIEQLLEWAYRVQCVDRQMARFSPRGPRASLASSTGEFARLGTRIDNSGFAARAHGLRLPDDAMIVHDTVLALGEMWIEQAADGQAEVWDAERAARQGQIIERRQRRVVARTRLFPGTGRSHAHPAGGGRNRAARHRACRSWRAAGILRRLAGTPRAASA